MEIANGRIVLFQETLNIFEEKQNNQWQDSWSRVCIYFMNNPRLCIAWT